MSSGSFSLWKTLLLPPLFALILYISIINLILPIFRRLRSRRTPSTSPPPSYLPAWLRSRFSQVRLHNLLYFPGRSNLSNGDNLLGDEELEEGLMDYSHQRGREEGDESRLSRELEVGFRDESDDEEDVRILERR